MNRISDDTDIHTRSYFNIEDFMRRTGINEEEMQGLQPIQIIF